MAELFYPKELKKIIADLRAKDDLNEMALKTLNKPLNIVIFPILFVAVLLLIKQIIKPTTGIEFPISLIIIILLYIPYYIDGLWRTYHASYLYGEMTEGIVQKVLFASAGVVRLDVINNKTYDKHRVCMAIPIRFSNPHYLPIIGQTIAYYLEADDLKYIHPNPCIYEYMSRYCLQKSMT